MASDIEGQSSTQQEHPRDPEPENPRSHAWSCLATRRIAFKAWKCLVYALFTTIALWYAPSSIVGMPTLGTGYGDLSIFFAPPLIRMVICIWPESLMFWKNVSRSAETQGMVGVYTRSRRGRRQRLLQRGKETCWKLIGRAGLLLLGWLVVTLTVPMLQRVMPLGSPLSIWSFLAVTITFTFFQALIIYEMPLYIITITGLISEGRKGIIGHKYYFFGLRPSMTRVVYFVLLLVSWTIYFDTEFGLKNPSIPHLDRAFEYVTWTLVSLLVGSILLFFKNLLLLTWSASVVYGRFQPRILITGVKYLYLCTILGDFFDCEILTHLQLLEEYTRHRAEPSNFNFTNYITSLEADTSYLLRVCEYLEAIARPQLKEDGVPDVVEFLRTKIINPHTDTCQPDDLFRLLRDCPDFSDSNLAHLEEIRRKKYGRNVVCCTTRSPTDRGHHDYIPFSPEEYRNNIANIFHCIVREQCASEDNSITFQDLKKWLVDAHMNCVNMGRTMVDANAIVTSLDVLLSFIIFFIVVLLWLLITGLATTKILVTLSTPLLALTFMFGDSTKTFFQGIIFCFATHAFDVGDRCILDNTELEVKSIGIMTTTFVKIGTMEKRMYPNSTLATKAIVNLGWQPDPSDVVELTLDSSTTSIALQEFEAKIQQFFSDPAQKGYFEESHEIIMKETGGTKKVTIQFTHVLNVNEMTHGQCMHKKNKQRSTFLKKINQFLDPESPTTPENGHGRGSMNTASSQVGLESIQTTLNQSSLNDPESPTTPENGHGMGSINTASSQIGPKPILTTPIR